MASDLTSPMLRTRTTYQVQAQACPVLTKMMRKISLASLNADAPAPPSLPAALSDASQPFPRLIVFDLDYTLWDFWCDTHPSPPLKPDATHSAVTDRHGEVFTPYPAVPSLLCLLPALPSSHRIRLAVASRTSAPPVARDLLRTLQIAGVGGNKRRRTPLADVFDGGVEIYPGSKVRHMEALQRRTGVAYEDVLFFDDEARNGDVEALGVTMKLVRDGIDWEQVAQGVEEWRRRSRRESQG